ncbi:MAG: penicillin-binding protein 1A [Pseudomonadota bacterium]|nr:MAG: penicillin-binding protein 1A [Pseudomonadota bacterium]
MKPVYKKLIIVSGAAVLTLMLLGALTLLGLYAYLVPKLPSIETLKEVRLQEPLRVYARNGELIAEFGEMKRTPLDYDEFPEQLIKAVLAAEDDRFFEHPGVDYQGILRAAFHLVRTGERTQGGSTITMQVARNFFLSSEKTFLRKFNEIFLALKIESELSKQQILELYLNKIYLGKRAYGFAAAALVYYGKDIGELTLPELAMVAGLPKAPSSYNPINNPQRALLRRDYVLNRMYDLGFIDEENHREAIGAADEARVYAKAVAVEAPYVAEMVRSEMLARYGSDSYSAGYKVVTTVDADRQRAANRALRNALLGYERRHGYRGVAAHVDLFVDPHRDDSDVWREILGEVATAGGLIPALVFEVDEQEAFALDRDGNVRYLPWERLQWARTFVDENTVGPELTSAHEVLKPGDIVLLHAPEDGCSWLAQVPRVEGALVSLDPADGAMVALVGGFDYYSSKFNRAVQAERQPGSSFKPFIYTAALDKGFTAASIINDAPVVFEAPGLEDTWRPENYSGRFYGPTRLREALVHSRNLVSIRLLRDIGIGYAVRYVKRFGFDTRALPRDLSLALGSGTLTPLQVATGFTVFANDGYQVTPYYIDHIIGPDDTIVMRTVPTRVCPDCDEAQAVEGEAKAGEGKDTSPQASSAAAAPPDVAGDAGAVSGAMPVMPVKGGELAPVIPGVVLPDMVPANRVLSPQTVFLMNTMLRDVIGSGTGRRALQLGRRDLAGKTGTTNDQQDAWFSGFNHSLVTTSWIGFDTPQPLGSRETGGRAALPMWIEYMGEALRGVPESALEQPPGLVSVRIDSRTGRPAGADTPDAVFEFFLQDQVPDPRAPQGVAPPAGAEPADITEQLF